MPRVLEADQFVHCRTLGHSWETFNDGDYKGSFSEGSRLSLRCVVCTTIRRDFINQSNGKLFARFYAYPKNYESDKGTDDLIRLAAQTKREAYRIEFLERLNHGRA